MVDVVEPNLSLNLNQFFQKHILLNDLQYDYYSKYLAAACKSQAGSEVVILTKEGSLLNVLSHFNTEFEPVFVSWVQPSHSSGGYAGYRPSGHSSSNVDNMLVVVTTDNALSIYRNSYSCVGGWNMLFTATDLDKSISCLATSSLPGSDNLVVALGSHLGSVTVVPFNTHSLTTGGVSSQSVASSADTLNAHNGGVSALAFSSPDSVTGAHLTLATGGLDNTVKLWEYDDKFMLRRALKLSVTSDTHVTHLSDNDYTDLESNRTLKRVNSLAFSKRGELAAATENSVYLFNNPHDWALFQVLNLGPSSSAERVGAGPFERLNERGLVVSFSNDKLVVMKDMDTFVLRRSDAGLFEMDSKLEH